LILLDEPFAAVDPKTTEDIRANIRQLADSGIGILVTDHNVREVFRTADRVYLITDGKVVTRGTPHQLVNDQIAIDAYLGRSFEEDGFTRQYIAKQAALAGQTVSFGSPAPTRPAAPEEPAVLPFPAPPPPPPMTGVAGAILELERLRQLVESLADDRTVKAATVELAKKGEAAITPLIEALERREAVLRRRAFELLKFLARDAGPLHYDPDAADEIRLRQVAYLRARLERRR